LQASTRASSHEVVGREAELAVLHDFLEPAAGRRALVVTGVPGIGKTTLWEATLDAARERGVRVLAAQASSAETQLSFAALIDLLDGVSREELSALPSPQLRGLEVALLRAEPTGPPPERAVALGVLNGIRALAAREPVLIAIDDVQWLDPSSMDALAYAARRFAPDGLAFLLTRRPGRASALEQSLGRGRVSRLEVGPLSLGALRRLLSEHLGLTLPRHLLRRITDATLGNPLFALELGRELTRAGLPAIGEDLPVPDAIEELLGTRVSHLPASTRKVLLAAALSVDPTPAQLAAIASAEAVDDAVDAGVLLVDGSRVRASHPLLAAAAKKRSRPRTRRELHLELAGVVADEELRARHLALGAEHPSVDLAATVARAAAAASARGARQDAVELATHALRLTPKDAAERPDRVLELAGYLELAGEPQRVAELLRPELATVPSGEARVRALVVLAECAGSGGADVHAYLHLAIAESGADPRLRAYVLPAMANVLGFIPVERLRDAEAWAEEAVPAARAVAPEVEELALEMLAWTRALRGCPIEDVCERLRVVSGAAGYVGVSADRVEAQRFAWRGEVERARTEHSRLLRLADERGEATSSALQRLHLCELELRAGDCDAAARLLDEWDESSDRELLPAPIYERCRALLAAARGNAREAEDWAAQAIAIAEETGVRWNWLEALRARGIAALLAHEPARAVESLQAVWARTLHEGVDEPGVFPVAPELVEALAETGDVDGARTAADRLRDLAEQQEHPWGLASAKRCDALVRFASRVDAEQASVDLEEAAAAYGGLGLRFDRARTLLLLGRAQRRRKRWAAARRALEQAVGAFEELGAPGWGAEARAELERVGARRAQSDGALSPAEQRVATLAAEGLSNKEIAQTLFVTVKTVETHLSRVYAKLGVRSRSQLAARQSSR
jgi:DNA-binding CsgD family transcriptional regulator